MGASEERDHTPASSPVTWPTLVSGSVSRDALLDRRRTPSLVTVLAPLGFGKTTLLVQHAQRQGRPVLWITLDRHDDDVVAFASKLVAALELISPADHPLQRALAAPGASIWANLVPRLLATLATVGSWLLVFDDLTSTRMGR